MSSAFVALLGLRLAQPKKVHLGRNGLAHFRIFFRFWDGFLSILLFSMRKQQENRMILPLKTSSITAFPHETPPFSRASYPINLQGGGGRFR
jgi:hypothetical protein